MKDYSHDRKLKPESEEDVKAAETVNGQRALIRKYGWHDNLVHRILMVAERDGLSGEDTMTMIAYHALLEREEMRERILRDVMSRPAVGVVPSQDTHSKEKA